MNESAFARGLKATLGVGVGILVLIPVLFFGSAIIVGVMEGFRRGVKDARTPAIALPTQEDVRQDEIKRQDRDRRRRERGE